MEAVGLAETILASRAPIDDECTAFHVVDAMLEFHQQMLDKGIPMKVPNNKAPEPTVQVTNNKSPEPISQSYLHMTKENGGGIFGGGLF